LRRARTTGDIDIRAMGTPSEIHAASVHEA
jgi:hypothetical protein